MTAFPAHRAFRGPLARVAAVAALALAACLDAHAITLTRNPANAAACTSIAAPGFTVNWTNPGRASASDNSFAQANVDGSTTRLLRCLNYGFTVPAQAKVVGIQVDVERRSNRTSNGGSHDAAMRIVQGGAIGTVDRSTGTTYPTADAFEAHGGAADLWGLAWTAADVNAANFGAAFAATKPSSAGPAHQIRVDLIRISVTYAPVVVSLTRVDANPTAAASVSWTLTFSHAVTGVDAGDFALVQAGGVSGAAITSVVGGGTVWTVTATTGTGNGTLGLDVVDNDSIVDAGGTPLGGALAGDGNFTGEVYTINKLNVATLNGCSPDSNCPAGSRLHTRIANRAFALYLAALKPDGTVETAFNGSATVSLVGRIAAGGPVGADNCPTGATDLTQALGSLAFAAGKRTLTGVVVANAYRDVRVRFACDAANCPPAGVTSCSTDNFAVRPDDLAVTATIASPLKAGTVALGDTFTLHAQARANAAATTTYNGTPQVDTAQVAAVISGPNVTGTLDGAFASAAGGTANGTFAYGEVGHFAIGAAGVHDSGASRFTLADPFPGDCSDDFNNAYAAADPASKVGCRFANQAASANLGRFTPDAFVALADGVPIPPIPSVTPFCGSGPAGFTYEGQSALRLRFTLEARNKAGVRTMNYDASYANGNGLVEVLAENLDDNIDRSARMGHGALPWPVWTSGRFTADKTGAFSRSPAAGGPFDSLEIGVRVTTAAAANGDGDGIRVSPEDMAVAAKNGLKLPGTTRVRFGRLWLTSAYGAENLPLPVPLEAQYWNGFGFVANDADNCTTLVAANTNISAWNPAGFSANLTAANVALGGAFVAGRGNLKLLAPGARGSAQVCVDLDTGAGLGDTTCQATTPASRVHLQAKRAASPNYDRDPAATVGFGVFKGPDSVIYRRENY